MAREAVALEISTGEGGGAAKCEWGAGFLFSFSIAARWLLPNNARVTEQFVTEKPYRLMWQATVNPEAKYWDQRLQTLQSC
jgi:hypothetical protein